MIQTLIWTLTFFVQRDGGVFGELIAKPATLRSVFDFMKRQPSFVKHLGEFLERGTIGLVG